jgi:two-component system LytT family response regulator
MLKTLIVDDEFNGRETLALLLEQYCPDLQLVGSAGDMETANKLIAQEQPDLVFLDIQIGTQTIFELLNRLTAIHFEIIFISAYESYAIKAIRFMAIDYLLKPVNIDELVAAVGRARENARKRSSQKQLEALMKNLEQRDSSQHRIALATAESYELVQVSDILYCQAEGSYTRIHLTSGDPLFVSRHLKYYENLLSEYRFYRVHQSSLINLRYLRRVIRTDGGMVEMQDGTQLPLARNKRPGLLELLKIG